MIKKLVRFGIGLACAVGGFYLGFFIYQEFLTLPANNEIKIALMVFPGIIMGLIGYSIAPKVIQWVLQMTGWIEGYLQKMPIQELLGGAIGLIIALIIATLIGNSFSKFPLLARIFLYLPAFYWDILV